MRRQVRTLAEYRSARMELTRVCSIAGLVAARILHDHYERVVIIEPEGWLACKVLADLR